MPRGQRFDSPQARQLAFGCVAIFLLPFFAAAVWLLSEGIRAMQRHDAQGLAALLAGTGFLAVTLCIFALVFAGIRSAGRAAQLQACAPDQPWLWREEWKARRIPDRTATKSAALWVFAVFWNAITWPALYFIARKWQTTQTPLLYIFAVFPLIGIVVLCMAIYAGLRRWRFGRSVCTIDQLPLEPGRTFHGEITLHGDALPDSGYRLLLACIQRVETGSGKNRTVIETPLWTEESRVSAAAAMRSPMGDVRVPFSLAVPAEARSTDLRRINDEILWRLDVSAELPGVDYAASFELPVFSTGRSADGQEIASYRVAHQAAAARRPLAADSGIEVEAIAGGIECRVRTRRTAGAVVGYVVFTAVWFGALVLMFQKNAGCAAIVVFALLGLVLLAAAVDYIAGVSIIRVDRGGISVRRQVLKWNWSWSLASEAIESVESRVDAQSRRRSTFDVAANTRPGRRTLARYIRNADDAEALAARIWSALGRA